MIPLSNDVEVHSYCMMACEPDGMDRVLCMLRAVSSMWGKDWMRQLFFLVFPLENKNAVIFLPDTRLILARSLMRPGKSPKNGVHTPWLLSRCLQMRQQTLVCRNGKWVRASEMESDCPTTVETSCFLSPWISSSICKRKAIETRMIWEIILGF